MLFTLVGSATPRQGRLTDEHPGYPGVLIVADASNMAFLPAEVATVIADDEPMAETAKKAGYKVQTPMSLHLGAGATDSTRPMKPRVEFD